MDAIAHPNFRPQSLPNECFLIVIDHLRDDLRTLHSLLTVNRFMFHATLPHILHKPFDTWRAHLCNMDNSIRSEQIFALLLVSILRYHPYKTTTTTSTPSVETTAANNKALISRHPAEELVRRFGLQFQDREQLEKFPLLMEYLNDNNPQRRNNMTVDYSTFLADLANIKWVYIRDKFFRLRRLPFTMEDRFGDLGTETMVLDVDDDEEEDPDQDRDEDRVHDQDQQQHEHYRDAVWFAFRKLVLQTCAESFTHLDWSLHKDDPYLLLPLANRMARLRTLSIVWGTIVDQDALQAVKFFQIHRQTFPSQCLHLEMNTSWISYLLHQTLANSELSFRKSKMIQYIRPKMMLYHAQKQPLVMDGSFVLDFFETVTLDTDESSKILLDQVREFIDNDENRQLYREPSSSSSDYVHDLGPRHKFLEACTNLVSIREWVTHRDMFAWAVIAKRDRLANKMASQQVVYPKNYSYLRHYRHYHHQHSALPPSAFRIPKLSHVTLISRTRATYHDILTCANDALEAFSESLHSIDLTATMEESNPTIFQTPSWIQGRQDLRCTGLLFPYALPYLTTLRLDFEDYAGGLVALGDLTAKTCPVLESLWVRMGVEITSQRLDGESANQDLEGNNDDDDEEDLDSSQTEEDLEAVVEELDKNRDNKYKTRPPKRWHLFPKFELPRLKTLILIGTAALRFDYDSLTTLPKLECLDLTCAENHALNEQLSRIPRLSHHLGLDDSTPKWGLDTWSRVSLPRLQTLRMEGPPAYVFEFSWLEAIMPALENLTLEVGGSFSVVAGPAAAPLSVSSGLCRAIDPIILATATTTTAYGTTSRAEPRTRRLSSSTLICVSLWGPWITTAETMHTLAGWIQGPKLRDLRLHRVPSSRSLTSVDDSSADDLSNNDSGSSQDQDPSALALVAPTTTEEQLSSSSSSDFELFRVLLDEIGTRSESLKHVELDLCDLTKDELKTLNLESLERNDYKYMFVMADGTFLVRKQ
ncbi:hypothetical protein BGZ83_008068 [Gryganskiella cystojenkinii]|nr:hypothetical protein BGZ83_008068 [Gryganskiella cystojenkinii]